MTYSIVARDPLTGELRVAVQTRWFNVGSAVPWAEPGVGAVATQSFLNIDHGPTGLALLRAGRSAPDALAELIARDAGEATRQVGIVDAAGRSAAHTGSRCVPEAGHVTAVNVSVQANMMERATVPPAMFAAYRAADGDLADRLMAALLAAEAEGGDVRGRQSSALLVVPGGTDAKPWTRRFDLRVDDSRDPLGELGRLLRLARSYEAFGRAEDLAELGDIVGALDSCVRARTLAPEDDMIALWHGVFLAAAGRVADAREALAAARAVEPRSAEHLRRFARTGHLHDAERVLDALGIEP